MTVADVQESQLRAVDDTLVPAANGEAKAPGHAYVDYRGLTKQDLKDAQAKLLMRMLRRGEEPTTDIGFSGDEVA